MKTLDHPNVIRLIDFAESRQYYYIILELAPGGELFHQIVRLTYFSEDLSRHVIVQVAKALEYLHEERGTVHRYVDPTLAMPDCLGYWRSRLQKKTVFTNKLQRYQTREHLVLPDSLYTCQEP